MSGKKNSNPILSRVVRIGIASILAIILMFLFLLVSSALILKHDWPEPIPNVLSYLCCLLPAFGGGFLCGKLLRKNGLLYGTISALPMVLALLCLCAVFYGKVNGQFLLCSSLAILTSGIGGICAVNKKHKRRYK